MKSEPCELCSNCFNKNKVLIINYYLTQYRYHYQGLFIMDAPLLATKDSLIVSVGKRIFSELQLLAMSINVITAVYSISATISLVSTPTTSESLNYCAHGEPLFEQAQCAYANQPTFIGFITVWILYFAVLLLYRFSHTSKFATSDLRFYLACDITNNQPFNQGLVLLGIALTLGCGGVGLNFALRDSFVASVGGIGQILVFVSVNVLALLPIRCGRFTSLQDPSAVSKALGEETPVQLPMASTMNLQGVVVSHADVFGYLMCAALADRSALAHGKTTSGYGYRFLSEMGNPRQLSDLAELLHSLRGAGAGAGRNTEADTHCRASDIT